MNRILIAALAAILAQPAWGECSNANPSPDTVRAATVGGSAPRLNFIKDASQSAGCPNSAAACQARAYVVPGDVVLTYGVVGAFTCASFTTGAGVSTSGLLPSAALSPVDEPAAADWTGHWRRVEADIVITGAGTALKIEGNATWGAMDPERVKRGGINLGDIMATATPLDSLLAFTEGDNTTLPYDKGGEIDCRVKMRRAGPYLVVADNGNCGGHNVSFSGTYRRR